MIIEANHPQTLYVGTQYDGVFKSTDGGQSWYEVNQGLTRRQIWSLAQHPLTGELYAGTEPSALYRSRNGGESWEECKAIQELPRLKEWTFPRPPHLSHIKAISFSQRDPNLIYCAVEEGWLIRSRDGGESWENLTEGSEFDAHDVKLMTDNEQEQLVLQSSGTGIYRSSDGGNHFSPAMEGLGRRYVSPIGVHPSRPQLLVVAAAKNPPPFWFIPGRGGADSAFYRSSDQGKSWQPVANTPYLKGGSWTVGVDPADPDTFGVGLHDRTVWLSEDGGESFCQIVAGLPLVGTVTISRR
jgi:photosystem II stability/assembly factor-like uncharacterized protein